MKYYMDIDNKIFYFITQDEFRPRAKKKIGMINFKFLLKGSSITSDEKIIFFETSFKTVQLNQR